MAEIGEMRRMDCRACGSVTVIAIRRALPEELRGRGSRLYCPVCSSAERTRKLATAGIIPTPAPETDDA